MQVNKSLSYNMMVFPVHVLNFINLNQSTATSLKKTQKKLESSSCMQWVGGLVSTIIRRYQGSCTLLRYCSSAGWVHEVCPDRDLMLQESVRIFVAVVCLLFFFRYLHTNHFHHKDVAFPCTFRAYQIMWSFEAQQPSGTSPRNPMKETTSFWCPPAAMVIWKKTRPRLHVIPVWHVFLFSHSESFSRTNPSNVHQKKNDKKQIGYLAYMLDSYSPAQ